MEIGPGTGALTNHLLGRSERLILVELDDELAKSLQSFSQNREDVDVIHEDFLRLDLSQLVEDFSKLVVIGNIPYNITAPIIFKLMNCPRPREIVLMVQREVAERLIAEVGTSQYGALSVGLRAVAEVEKVLNVPRRAFRPVPRVDSALVRIRPFDPPPMTPQDEKFLRVVTRSVFQWRRKQIQKILRDHHDLKLPKDAIEEISRNTGWDLSRRPETFAPSDFIQLAFMIQKFLFT
jgi:16S rRNA (adenine1518-N6/adenine1519-N6)-dimethyltransferase